MWVVVVVVAVEEQVIPQFPETPHDSALEPVVSFEYVDLEPVFFSHGVDKVSAADLSVHERRLLDELPSHFAFPAEMAECLDVVAQRAARLSLAG